MHRSIIVKDIFIDLCPKTIVLSKETFEYL